MARKITFGSRTGEKKGGKRERGDEGREDGLRIFDLPFVKRTREQKTPRKRERERGKRLERVWV